MRTTLTLDDDLAGLLKERARDAGISFKDAVNRAIRSGLGEPVRAAGDPVVTTKPHSFGFAPGIDLDKLNQLADELEAESAEAGRPQVDPARRQRSRPRS